MRRCPVLAPDYSEDQPGRILPLPCRIGESELGGASRGTRQRRGYLHQRSLLHPRSAIEQRRESAATDGARIPRNLTRRCVHLLIALGLPKGRFQIAGESTGSDGYVEPRYPPVPDSSLYPFFSC